MLKLIYDKTGKEKTFETEMDVNWFLGAYTSEVLHQQVTEETYIKLCTAHNCKMTWDDDTEMTPHEWVRCALTIYKKLD